MTFNDYTLLLLSFTYSSFTLFKQGNRPLDFETSEYVSTTIWISRDWSLSSSLPPFLVFLDLASQPEFTGGKGQYTQWVHCEFIVGSETICLAHTQWVSGECFHEVPTNSPSPNPGGKWWAHLKSTHQFTQQNTWQVSLGRFQKVPINSPGSYPAGKWWALLQSTQHKTQLVLFEQTPFVLSQSVHNVPRGYFVKEPFEFFHNVPINLIKMCPLGSL